MRSNERAIALASFLRVSLSGRASGRGPAAPERRGRPPSRIAPALRRFSVALVAALALPRAAPAMEVSAGADPYGRFVIYATGPIRTGDADRFRHALDGAGNRQAHLAISSGGGLIQEAMRIARMVTSFRVPVVAGDVCASACFLILAASPDRTAAPFSRVGVHRAYSRETGESAGSLNATMEIARYAASMGVPAPIVGRLVTTPGSAGSMEWLTADDLRSMGVRFTQPAAPPRPAATAAAASPQTPPPSRAAAGAMAEAGRADRVAYRRWLPASRTAGGRERHSGRSSAGRAGRGVA